MARSVREILSYNVETADGHRRPFEDILLDDRGWSVRYIVMETSRWLDGQRVLVSPQSFGPSRWSEGIVPLKLTTDQIRKSPPLSADQPVSLEHQRELAEYYEWPPPELQPPLVTEPDTSHLTPDSQALADREESRLHLRKEGDVHLYSAKELLDAVFRLTDETEVPVADILIGDEDWKARGWVGTRSDGDGRVLIESRLVGTPNADGRSIPLAMDSATLAALPPFSWLDKLGRAFDESLAAHGRTSRS